MLTSSSTLNKILSGITQVIVEAGRPPVATQVRTISSASIPDSSSIITDSTTAENGKHYIKTYSNGNFKLLTYNI
jgi:hypothetical protein